MIKIRQARKRKELSVRDLANLVGVSHTTIADIERGRRNPSGKVLKAICAALGIDRDTFKPLPPEHPVYEFARWVEKHVPRKQWEAKKLEIMTKVGACIYPESPSPMETNEENYGNLENG